MGNAVLISIRPEYCYLIAIGRKTLELRKIIPIISPPYKVYLYCTKGQTLYRSEYDGQIRLYHKRDSHAFDHHTVLNGKVIGEWMCNYILPHCEMSNADFGEQRGLVNREKIYEYSGFGEKEVKGLDISDLKIYDEPKELSEFYHWCGWSFFSVERAPQSWMYVEELK